MCLRSASVAFPHLPIGTGVTLILLSLCMLCSSNASSGVLTEHARCSTCLLLSLCSAHREQPSTSTWRGTDSPYVHCLEAKLTLCVWDEREEERNMVEAIKYSTGAWAINTGNECFDHVTIGSSGSVGQNRRHQRRDRIGTVMINIVLILWTCYCYN